MWLKSESSSSSKEDPSLDSSISLEEKDFSFESSEETAKDSFDKDLLNSSYVEAPRITYKQEKEGFEDEEAQN